MAEIINKFQEIIDKYKKEGKLEILSLEESRKISNRIDYEMRKVRREYRRREKQSEIEAEKIYIC